MDKALLVLDGARKLKARALWQPDLFYMAMRQQMPLPPLEHNTDMKRLPFDAASVTHILPFLDGDVFDNYMQHLGAFLWKSAEIEHLGETLGKQVVMLVLQRPKLENLLMAYLTLWDEDAVNFPHHLYSLGLGRLLRLTHYNLESKTLYYKQMSSNEYIFLNPISPLIKHIHSYTFNPDDFYAVTQHVEKKPMLPQHHIPPQNLFYIKLTYIAVRATQHRWSEVWAQALSALDHYQSGYDCYHDLMCFLALSAGMNSLSESIIYRALEEARLVSSEVEHIWKRILVFQALSTQWGYYDLEKDIFEFGRLLLCKKTDHYNKLVRQHMDSLLRQCEDIDLFVRARRKYHEQCSDKTLKNVCCKQPVIYNYSFLKKDDLLREMDQLLPLLEVVGDKEYYKGIIHHYQTHKDMKDPDTVDILHRQIGSKFLSIASKMMKPGDIRFMLCTLLLKAVDHGTFELDTFMRPLELLQMSKWSPECATLWIQVALFSMAGNPNHYMGGQRMMQFVTNAYRHATHNQGYRKYILQAAYRLSNEETFVHVNHLDIPDYPLLPECFGREHRHGKLAQWFWKQEKDMIYKKLHQLLDHHQMPTFIPDASTTSAAATSTSANASLSHTVEHDHDYPMADSSEANPMEEDGAVADAAAPTSTVSSNLVTHFDQREGVPRPAQPHAIRVVNDEEDEEEEEEEEIDDEEEDGEAEEDDGSDDDGDNETIDTIILNMEQNAEALGQESVVAAVTVHSHNNNVTQFVENNATPIAEPASDAELLRAGPSPPKKSRSLPTHVEELLVARDFLELDHNAEDVYAFGCHLIHSCAE